MRSAAAEALGTAFLLVAVVGSGIMGQRVFDGDIGLTLFANAVATGAALVALILAFGPISGAHFNPVVTVVLAAASRGATPRWSEVPAYLLAQVAGAVVGVFAAHLMFGQPILEVSGHARSGVPQLFSEFVATFGLLAVVWSCSRYRSDAASFAVGLYITGAYWFTASTSFANPAVTIARAFTDSFAGIRPSDVPGFIGAQVAGATVAAVLFPWLFSSPAPGASVAVNAARET